MPDCIAVFESTESNNMIAAVVLLALVASSQVQAFDQAVEVQGARGVNYLCMLKYASQIKKLADTVEAKRDELTTVASGLLVNFVKCSQIDNIAQKGVCFYQTVVETWNENEVLRAELAVIAKDAIALLQEVNAKCITADKMVYSARPIAV